ncbi:hypothetical protein N752_07960 [Desulforamulus aquiferis]|nr:hypothetical protein N752_07960 [Desulforamulus aquiferis]
MTKVITELNFPTDIYYFHEHTWARVEGDVVRVGISDFAQDSLGDIIFVELPNEGESFDKNDEFGQAESAKPYLPFICPLGEKFLR